MMYLVSEVHPFVDGNSRIARIMMNAELWTQNLVTIIVPTVLREDYLLALRALTRRGRPSPLVQLMVRAQRVSAIDFGSYPPVLRHLQERHWFAEPEEARLID